MPTVQGSMQSISACSPAFGSQALGRIKSAQRRKEFVRLPMVGGRKGFAVVTSIGVDFVPCPLISKKSNYQICFIV
jgi:hypothetical protein